jgi:diacylglycerol kinase family enzyme
MRLLLVYNPRSRLSLRVPREALLRCLEAEGAEVLDLTTDSADAVPAVIAEAARAGCDRVVVAGGDGTVSPALQVLPGAGLALAVIPLGTGNVLAEELGLRTGDWRGACHAAVAGPAMPMDLGLAGGRYFATMFGAGMDAQVAYDLAAAGKRVFGRMAFVGELLRCMARSMPCCFTIALGDETLDVRAWAAVVSNTPRYVWRLYFRPAACPDDGLLDLCILAPRSRPALFSHVALNFALCRPVLSAGLVCRTFTSARIDADPPVPWQADGEVMGTTPVEIRIAPGALPVVVAPSRARV